MADTVTPLEGEILPKETTGREFDADGLTVQEFKLSDLKVDDNYTRPSVVVLGAGEPGTKMLKALSGAAGMASLASIVLMQENILVEEGFRDPAYDITANPGRDMFDEIYGMGLRVPLPRSRAPSRELENGNIRRRLAKYDYRSPEEKRLAAQVEARASAKETKKLNARRQKNAARARSKKGR